jgi:excisionase family DNA binding protein
MSKGTRKPHADTLATVRVALRADPAHFDAATIARATAAVVAAIGDEVRQPDARAVSQAEAARLLACSRWSIRRLVAAGKLTPRRLLGGLVRFDRQQIEQLISQDQRP